MAACSLCLNPWVGREGCWVGRGGVLKPWVGREGVEPMDRKRGVLNPRVGRGGGGGVETRGRKRRMSQV